MAGSQAKPVIEVRALTQLEEVTDAVRLQKEIWGFEDIELLPLRLFVVATKIGGQAFGAYDGLRMVGFCLAIPGLKPGGKYYLHSHMLGVTHDYRNAGVGRLLKLAQRDDAIARGVPLMEWTFDPLEIKNAYFNMQRLGAIVRRHVYNQYGLTSSHLHGGLPTDRCVAEWYLDTDRVRNIIAGTPPPQPPIEARIEVPTAIERLRLEDPAEARRIQKTVSDQFQLHFSNGLAVVGVEKNSETGTFLLAKWDSK